MGCCFLLQGIQNLYHLSYQGSPNKYKPINNFLKCNCTKCSNQKTDWLNGFFFFFLKTLKFKLFFFFWKISSGLSVFIGKQANYMSKGNFEKKISHHLAKHHHVFLFSSSLGLSGGLLSPHRPVSYHTSLVLWYIKLAQHPSQIDGHPLSAAPGPGSTFSSLGSDPCGLCILALMPSVFWLGLANVWGAPARAP